MDFDEREHWDYGQGMNSSVQLRQWVEYRCRLGLQLRVQGKEKLLQQYWPQNAELFQPYNLDWMHNKLQEILGQRRK